MGQVGGAGQSRAEQGQVAEWCGAVRRGAASQ